ncbi:MAG: exo-alpha-sialidase [Tyzzerella sp.]|nr:exo-alpha-sialidase [Tyzzerella sp.]
MKRIAKRIIAILLVVCCFCSVDSGFLMIQASNNDIFKDDFSKTSLTGWMKADVGTVSDGVYNITGDGTNLVSSPVSESKYVVQSRVTLRKLSGSKISTASIVIGSNATATEFYEFGIGVTSTGSTYTFLFKQGAGEQGTKTIYQQTKSVPGTKNGKIVANTEYILTVIWDNGVITCLINGEKVTSENIALCGNYVGLYSNAAKAKYDDFVVEKAGNKKVDSIRLLNTPKEVTVNGGGLSFDVQVIYSGLYGVETISSDALGVEILGFDGKTGKKKITVTYSGKTNSFETNVVAEAENTVLYEDNFSNGIDKEKWILAELAPNNGYKFNYTFKNTAGAVLVEFPTNIGNYTDVITAKADLDNAMLGKLTNYSVELDANIKKNTTVEGGRAADAALDVAQSKGQAFSYRVRGDGTAILYRYTTIIAQTTLPNFKLGTKFHMKAEVYDGVILCYYNDKCVLRYQGPELAANKRNVDVGFRAVNGTVQFDNFKVKTLAERSVWAANKLTIDDLETGQTNIATLQANGIDYGRYLVNLYFSDGSVTPVAFEESMISGYQESSRNEQKIIFQYGPFKKTLTYKYTALLFSDSFVSGPKPEWKDVSTKYKGYIDLTYKNGVNIQCVSDTASRELSQYVNLFADYPNVKVSADITMESIDNAKERRLGVRARYQKSSCYEYLFSYDPIEAVFYLVLYRVNSGTRVELKQYTEGMILEKTGLEDLYMGTSYHVALECIGNQLFMYFNGTLIDVYVDETEDAVLTGSGAGWRAVNTSGRVANFRVEEASTRTIKNITIPEIKGTVDLYQGFTLFPYDYKVQINYSDGTIVNKDMTVDMIGEFDNITPGKTEIPITLLGQTIKVTANILERPEYIKDFVKQINDCKKAKKITLKDKDTIDELEKIYKSLSGYEISNIDEKVIEKYHNLIETMYKLENPELKKYDMVYSDDFGGELIESDWSYSTMSAAGTWTTINGVLVNEQARYGWNDKISYIEYLNFNGKVSSVEADVMLTNPYGCYVSILSNICDLGYYHARITNEYLDSNGKPTFIVQLYKFVSSHRKLDETYVELKGIDMDVNEWHNLRLTNIDGMLTVYLDDIPVLSYNDSDASDRLTTGTFGFRALYGDMRHDSLRVMGTASEYEEYEPQIEPTYYKDDFEDEKEGENPSHWIEPTDKDGWRVYKKNNRLVYGTESKNLTYSWLHTFESDPTISLDFMVDNTAKSGRVEFLTRYTQAVYSYAGIGYDFAQSRWYIYAARGEDFEPRTTYAKEKFTLNNGEWYNIRIEEDGSNIKVYVNDTLTIEETNAYMTGYGRIGVLAESTNMYIDNLSYTMLHGGNVDDGVTEYVFDDELYGYISHLEIESLGGDTLIGVNGGNKYISTDKGKTWADTKNYTDVSGKGLSYPSILEISEGVYIMVYADTFEVYRSTDYMKTWTKIGNIIPDIGGNRTEYGSWQHLIHVNSLTKVTLEDGKERIFLPIAARRYDEIGRLSNGHYTRIFYSDDGGATWTESENDTRDITPNYTENYDTFFSWAEAKVIKCSDGTLRMYNTRSYDCVVYTESDDGGVTWKRLESIPYLQNGQTSFGVAEDPKQPGTYYMVCLNAKTFSYNSMQPRNRLTLVKSTDGKNWEFVTDVERFTSFSSYLNPELYQIIDPSISIIDGYMYITMGRSYHGTSGGHGEQSVLLVRMEMDKLTKTSEWNDSNIADPTRAKTIEIEEMPQNIFGVGDLFVVYGGKLKITAFNGNVTYEEPRNLAIATKEPNMYAKGTYNVSLMNMYAQYVSYDIEVTDNYNITWNIVGQGEVTPYFVKIAKGLKRTFTAVPEEGWKIDKVLVNGEKIRVKDNTFSITGSEDITVEVIFTDKIGDATVWIGIIAATTVIGGVIAIYLFKKEWLIAIKNKMKEVNKWKR